MREKPAIINVMERAARKAARGLLRDFGEVENLQVSRKGPADFVTAADLRAESVLREELSRARPAYSMIFEEGGQTKGEDTGNAWVVDPLDGTTNFLHGIPHFAISIAHVEQGVPIAALILEPTRDELFWALRGEGAYVNFRRLRVSSRKHLQEALVATGLPFKGNPKNDAAIPSTAAVIPQVAGVRRFGSAALDLAWTAAGRYDGFWEFGLKPWDIAAGILLVREAGGMVSDMEGRDRMLQTGDILATNGGLHTDLGLIIRAAR
jgi:myo-inositol-1(or 4)-monophosphatase